MMFWRSVVGKLAVTILLLVSFVLFILTILLLEFFENFHIKQEEDQLMQMASNVAKIVKQYDDRSITLELVETVKEPSSKIVIYFSDDERWVSDTSNVLLLDIETSLENETATLLNSVLKEKSLNKKLTF